MMLVVRLLRVLRLLQPLGLRPLHLLVVVTATTIRYRSNVLRALL